MLQALVPHARRLLSLTLAGLALMTGFQLACARQEAPAPAAQPVADTTGVTTTAAPPPYTFDQPHQTFELDKNLQEISGLTVLNERLLGAVEDENGKLYMLDMQTGKIERDEKFEKDGDYEGVERVGKRVFILNSKGTLFEIADWQAKDYEVKKHTTDLSSKYDTEGLAYDEANNRLLIACKEFAGKGMNHQKAIYAFDLATMKLLEKPAFVIDTDTFTEQAKKASTDREEAVNQVIRDVVDPVLDLSGFKPSALAIHPRTKELYVLSSVRKAVVVLDENGSIAHVWPLNEDLLVQPEGIAFLPTGDLFIASEGQGGKGTLMRFTYRP